MAAPGAITFNTFQEIRGTPFRVFRWDFEVSGIEDTGGGSSELQQVIPYQGPSDYPPDYPIPDEVSFVQNKKDFSSGGAPEGDATYVDFELTFFVLGGELIANVSMTNSVVPDLSDTVGVTYWFKWYKSNEGGISTFPTVPVP